MSVALQCAPQHERDGRVGATVVIFEELAPCNNTGNATTLGLGTAGESPDARGPQSPQCYFPAPRCPGGRTVSANAAPREQMVESLAEIKTEVTRLHNLVQDYLSLARLVNLRREPTDLGAMVEAFALERQEHFEARHIGLHLEGLEALGQVILQRQVFHRVLLNLTQNAIETMPQGGTLTFRGRRHPSQVSFDIQDTGTGIPAPDLGGRSRPSMPLPQKILACACMWQQVVRFHGGEITVASVPGQGTTYTITLPLRLARPWSRPDACLYERARMGGASGVLVCSQHLSRAGESATLSGLDLLPMRLRRSGEGDCHAEVRDAQRNLTPGPADFPLPGERHPPGRLCATTCRTVSWPS